jgi:hypothetical protein
MLPTGTDGWFLPIVCALAAALLLGTMMRRRPKATPSSDSPNAGLAGPLGYPPGRNPNLPRWLDPSIAAARLPIDTTTAVRAAAAIAVLPPREPQVFAGPIDERIERVLVRYDAVPLLDRPDDVLGQSLGELDGGDEAEILERGEIWTQVRTPAGAAGWIPSMTISGLVAVAADDVPEVEVPTPPQAQVSADEPLPLEAILEAITARRQASSTPGPAAPIVPKRPRSRKPTSDGPAAGA